MLTLKWQVSSSSNFVSFFIVMRDNSSVDFKLILFQLWIKGSHQNPNFETLKCSGQSSSDSSCQLWNDKSVPLQILRHSSLSWQITSLWIFSSYFFNFGLKDPIRIPILRLSSALVKICHIPQVIFQTTSQLKVILDKSFNDVLGEGM